MTNRSSPDWPTAASTVVATIGHPISHSLSPRLHQAAFDALGLDWVSVAFDVAPGEGGRAVEAARVLGIRGMSVTMPHKAEVAAGCDELTPLAERLGAVNCVTNDGGVLTGDCTDGQGLLEALTRGASFDPEGCSCVVIGAGGAARAIVAAVGDAGASDVAVVNRTLKRAEEVARLAGPAGRVGQVGDVSDADLVVNATPTGMNGSALVIDGVEVASKIRAGQIAVDLVYAPAVTPFVAAAAGAGAVALGGMGMLVHQAAIALRKWTGEDAPVQVMWRAIEAVG